MTFTKSALRGATAAALTIAATPAMAADVTYGSGVAQVGTAGYAENFNTLATGAANPNPAVTSSMLPTGWRVFESGDNGNGNYAVNSGASTTGDVYSYGAANATDRALGTLRSGSLLPTIGAVFSNATATTFSSLVFGYTGEQWRNGSASVDSLLFQYSLSSTNIADAVSSTAWTSVSLLDFTAPSNAAVGALDGNAAANRATLSATVTGFTIAPGAGFAIRWIDSDPAGADDGLAVDDFSVRGIASAVVPGVPEPGTWAMMILGFGVAGAGLRRRSTKVAFA